MKLCPENRYHHRFQLAVFLLGLILTAGLLAWLGERYPVRLDLTADGRHTLSPASRTVIQKLQAPLTITAFASDDKTLRKRISALLRPYLEHSQKISFEFIDPNRHPGQVRKLGIQANGELLLEYQRRSRQLRNLNEQTITQAMLQLQRSEPPLLLFLSGHGERSPARQANHDLSEFAAALKAQEFRLQTVLPAAGDPLPQEGILLISHPSVALLPKDQAAIEAFMRGGGKLLWLADPGHSSLGFLATELGLQLSGDPIIDPNAKLINAPENFVVARPGEYANHPITAAMQLTTVFPEACSITPAQQLTPQNQTWQQTPLITTARHSWVDINPADHPPDQPPQFNPGQDQPGPHLLGVALEQGPQRAVVICDGDFLSNRYLGNGGNLQLGLNLLNWLAIDEQFLDIPPYQAADAQLRLSQREGMVIAFGFLLLLPMICLIIAARLWWRRRESA
ncbi:MAG: GldG family protein [Gammaproteobacteria bacterium]|nr:GldG family protein [Gammaproteobacteria bacterium]